MEVFRRNAQPHIADMRIGGAWGYIPNKQMCVWGPRRIACKPVIIPFLYFKATNKKQTRIL